MFHNALQNRTVIKCAQELVTVSDGLQTVSRSELTLSLPIQLRSYSLPYWSNPPFLIFDIWAPCGLDQYGVEPFKQQKFGSAGVEGLNRTRVMIMTQKFYGSSGFIGTS